MDVGYGKEVESLTKVFEPEGAIKINYENSKKYVRSITYLIWIELY